MRLMHIQTVNPTLKTRNTDPIATNNLYRGPNKNNPTPRLPRARHGLVVTRGQSESRIPSDELTYALPVSG